MPRIMSVLSTVALVFFLAGPVLAAAQPQAACPVMGGKVNKEVYLDYQGQRVYFCCPACIEQFKKDPEKYLQKMKEQGVALEKTPQGK